VTELAPILDSIRERPDDGTRWLVLAGWLWDNGRDDEAAAVRVFWPTLRDNVIEAGVSLDETLRQLARHAELLGRRTREVQEREPLDSAE
jgi:uncharacterized protein (TIGR02996 family)